MYCPYCICGKSRYGNRCQTCGGSGVLWRLDLSPDDSDRLLRAIRNDVRLIEGAGIILALAIGGFLLWLGDKLL